MVNEFGYDSILRDEDYTHDQVLEELDDLVQSGQMTRGLHRVLMAALEVASEQ